MRTILTIDDSESLLTIVGRSLQPFGVELTEAENGTVGVMAFAGAKTADGLPFDRKLDEVSADRFSTSSAGVANPCSRAHPCSGSSS